MKGFRITAANYGLGRAIGGAVLGAVVLFTASSAVASTAPLVITYDAVAKAYTPALPKLLAVKRGDFFSVRVLNLNPLYRLKTSQEQLVISYAVPALPTTAGLVESNTSPIRCDLSGLQRLQTGLEEAQQYSIKLISDFERVRNLAHTTRLDETRTRAELVELTKDFADIIPEASSGGLSAVGMEQAVALWANKLSGYVSEANTRATASTVAANKCSAAEQELSKQVQQLAEREKARFDVLASRKDLVQLTQYWAILRDNDYTQTSGDIQVQGDRVLLTINVVKRDDFTELPQPQWDSLTLTIHAVSFWTMDLSAGILLNRLRDNSYSLRDDVTTVLDTVKKSGKYKTIEEDAPRNFRPGLATMLHVRYKLAPNFSVGPAVGLTINENKSVLQYHFGGSLLFGDRQRVVLTVGYSGGDVRRLRSDYQVGGRVPATITEVPTRSMHDGSFMVALTYNLTSSLTKLIQTAAE